MRKRWLFLSVALAMVLGGFGAIFPPDHLVPGHAESISLPRVEAAEAIPHCDIAIMGGRVMDPESGLDAVRNVGVKGGQVVVVTTSEISADKVINATGLVVAPGFIDILSYDPNNVGVWTKVADGITTNLGMHGGTASPEKWYPYYESQRLPVHFGASFFYTHARNGYKLSRYTPATPAQLKTMLAAAERALRNGCLGVSFALEYNPGITANEIVPLMRLAKRYNVPTFFHLRYSDMQEPGTNFDAVNEVIRYAKETGAAVHIDHITSTGGTFTMPKTIAMIDEARTSGLDFSACMYPYDSWATYASSARFDPGWQARFGITYQDLQLCGSTERLTAESFARYRKLGKCVVAYAIPADDVAAGLECPWIMMGSDTILEPGYNNHPRGSGMCGRLIGYYVREKKVLSLMDAIAKLTILPARRLEKQAPAMRRKGRLSPGADADIAIFSYERIRDHATVEHPEYMTTGVEYVLVGGAIVKDPSGLHKEVRNGKPIKGDYSNIPTK